MIGRHGWCHGLSVSTGHRIVSNTELHINTTVARIPWPVRTALDMNGGGRFHLSVGRSGEKGKTAPNSGVLPPKPIAHCKTRQDGTKTGRSRRVLDLSAD